MVTNSTSQSSSQDKSGKNSTELSNPTKFSYLATVLSPPLPEAQAKVTSHSPSGLASISTVDASNPASVEQPIQWFDADFVPNPSCTQDELVLDQKDTDLSVVTHKSPAGAFCIDCNNCGRSVANEHYHCSICENGDYDLCLQCVGSGVTCRSDSHWLIKRFVQDGIVTNGTTETIAPRKPQAEEAKGEKPTKSLTQPFSDIQEPTSTAPLASKAEDRICNACLKGRSLFAL